MLETNQLNTPELRKARAAVNEISPTQILRKTNINRRTVYNLRNGDSEIERAPYDIIIKLAAIYDEYHDVVTPFGIPDQTPSPTVTPADATANNLFQFVPATHLVRTFCSWMLNWLNVDDDTVQNRQLKQDALEFLQLLYADRVPFATDGLTNVTFHTPPYVSDVLLFLKTRTGETYALLVIPQIDNGFDKHDQQPYQSLFQSELVNHVPLYITRIKPIDMTQRLGKRGHSATNLSITVLRDFLTAHSHHSVIADFVNQLDHDYVTDLTAAKASVAAFDFTAKTPFTNLAEQYVLLSQLHDLDPQLQKSRVFRATDHMAYTIWAHKTLIGEHKVSRELTWRTSSDTCGRALNLCQTEDLTSLGQTPAFLDMETQVKNAVFYAMQTTLHQIDYKGCTDYDLPANVLVHIPLSQFKTADALSHLMLALGHTAQAVAAKSWVTVTGQTTLRENV